MVFLNLMLFLTMVSWGIAKPTTENPTISDTYTPLKQPQQYEIPATDLELPKIESSNVPFYTLDLATVLKPPQFNSEPDYYQVPIPAQDLIAPIQTAWNPDNDPKYYYVLPSTNYQQPTNEYPKKFSQTIHLKDKPLANKPKIEVELEAISEDQYEQKQKELTKNYEKLAKKTNQNELLKVQQSEEPKAEASFHNDNFNRGLNTEVLTSLGLTSSSSPKSDNNERLSFHMVGHDGPHSYKFGYDTGKGHNRHFRYEERDNSGIVKGHFGYYDKNGKLQMVHYDAEPHEGFHAEGNFGKY